MPNDILDSEPIVLVVVDPHLEVGLGERPQPELLVDVDEQPGLHPVAGEERYALQHGPAPRVLAGERLESPGQVRVEEVEHRAHRELGDPAAAAGGGR